MSPITHVLPFWYENTMHFIPTKFVTIPVYELCEIYMSYTSNTKTTRITTLEGDAANIYVLTNCPQHILFNGMGINLRIWFYICSYILGENFGDFQLWS